MGQKCKNNITGRSKRNISLPIFKNEPMDRNNEYTYKWVRMAGDEIIDLRLTERVTLSMAPLGSPF